MHRETFLPSCSLMKMNQWLCFWWVFATVIKVLFDDKKLSEIFWELNLENKAPASLLSDNLKFMDSLRERRTSHFSRFSINLSWLLHQSNECYISILDVMYGVSSPQLLWLLRTIVGWHNLAALTTPTKVSRTSPELNMDTNVTTHTQQPIQQLRWKNGKKALDSECVK